MTIKCLAITVAAATLTTPAAAQGVAGDPGAIVWAEQLAQRVGGKELWAPSGGYDPTPLEAGASLGGNT